MLAPGIRQLKDPWLRCALIRCAVAEAAAECGMDAAVTMADLERFHDTIRIDHLADMALSLRAPARVLLIDLRAHLAPRAIQHLGAVSEWLNPAVSIVQGSRNSNNWARTLLHGGLERAQAHVSWVYPYQWVDDVNLLAIGTQRLIEIHSPHATLELLAGLRNKGLRISTKPQIVASRPVQAKRLAFLLDLEGEHFKVATVGKDSGIDFSGGRNHRRLFHRKRTRAATQRARRIRFIKKHKGQRSGCAQPVSYPRFTSLGSQTNRAGRCPCHSLFHRLRQEGPSCSCSKRGLEVWTDSGNFRRCTRRAWPRIFARISEALQNRRWRRHLRPIGSIIAVLLDCGWDAPHSGTMDIP